MKKIGIPLLLIILAPIVIGFTASSIISNYGIFYNNVTIGNGSNTIIMNGTSGDINTVGIITASDFISTSQIVQNTITTGNLTLNSTTTENKIVIEENDERNINISSSGNIETSGNITANKYYGDGSSLTGISTYEHPEQIVLNDSRDTGNTNALTINREYTTGAGFSANNADGIVINHDITLGSATTFSIIERTGLDIIVDETYDGFTGNNLNSVSGIKIQVASNNATLQSVLASDVAVNAVITDNSSAQIFGAYTKAIQSGSGIANGYQGYGSNTGSDTGLNAVGVYGFGHSQNGIMVGIRASSFSSHSEKGYAFLGDQGHWWSRGGNHYIWESKVITDTPSTEFILNSTDGSLFVERDTQINGTTYANIPHAEAYNVTENGYTITIGSLNTWVNITGLLEGETHEITMALEGFNITKKGRYKLDWSVSFSGTGGSTHKIGALINGIEHEPCTSYRKLGTAGDVGNTGGTCIFTANEGDILTGAVQDISAPAQDIEIWSVNANILRVGQ